jgi:hypothetical protein
MQKFNSFYAQNNLFLNVETADIILNLFKLLLKMD